MWSVASESNRNGSAGNNGCEPALIQAPNYTWAESPMHKLLKCFLEQSAIFGAIRWVTADPNPQLCRIELIPAELSLESESIQRKLINLGRPKLN